MWALSSAVSIYFAISEAFIAYQDASPKAKVIPLTKIAPLAVNTCKTKDICLSMFHRISGACPGVVGWRGEGMLPLLLLEFQGEKLSSPGNLCIIPIFVV